MFIVFRWNCVEVILFGDLPLILWWRVGFRHVLCVSHVSSLHEPQIGAGVEEIVQLGLGKHCSGLPR